MRNKIDPFLLKRYLEGNCTAKEKGGGTIAQTAEGRAQLQSLMVIAGKNQAAMNYPGKM